MNETWIEDILCITVFHTTVFSSAALDHHPHKRPRIGKLLWRETDCSND